jgi:DHA2 family multidrug resistance protein-like MFS transporter
VRQSVFGGVAVADKLGSASLLNSVRTSFVHGMDTALLVAAAIAVAGVVIMLVFLPQTNAVKDTTIAVTGHGVGHVRTRYGTEHAKAA